jgi:hypothetical protein
MPLYLIFTVSIIVWLLPPFKQKGTEYFFFFFVMAFSDPLAIGLCYLHLFNPQQFYVILELLLIFALNKNTNRNRISVLTATVAYLLIYKLMTTKGVYLVSVFLLTIILLIIIYRFMLYVQTKKCMNLFYILLILYQVTLVVKFIALIVDIDFGLVQFYLTSIIEIAFGIIFIFVNIRTKDFRLFKESKEVL